MLLISSAFFDIRDRTAHYHILSLWVADFASNVEQRLPYSVTYIRGVHTAVHHSTNSNQQLQVTSIRMKMTIVYIDVGQQ
jgi:hypothetical protein